MPFEQFPADMAWFSDDVLETVAKLLAPLTDSNVKAIKVQLCFVAQHMQPIYDLIASFPKQTGATPLSSYGQN